MVTINQIVKELSDFASDHLQINSFGTGEIEMFATSGSTEYPCVFVEFLPFSTEERVYTISMRVYLMDRLQKESRNIQEILSDTQQIMLDLVAHFNNHTLRDYRLSANNSFNPIFDRAQDDEVGGWYVDLTWRLRNEYNRCQIPSN